MAVKARVFDFEQHPEPSLGKVVERQLSLGRGRKHLRSRLARSVKREQFISDEGAEQAERSKADVAPRASPPTPRHRQSNRLETLASSEIRRIASASSGAMVRRRTLPSLGSASPVQIESVTTSSDSSDAPTRAMAPPDSTP